MKGWIYIEKGHEKSIAFYDPILLQLYNVIIFIMFVISCKIDLFD
jgi:hypothetical protein